MAADHRPLSDEPVAKRLGNRFGFGVDLEFFVDAFYVKTDSVEADSELRRGRLVVVSLDQQF